MSFTESDAKALAAGIKRCFDTSKPLHVQVEVDVMDTEDTSVMSVILSGRPPGLTTTIVLNGVATTYMGNPENPVT